MKMNYPFETVKTEKCCLKAPNGEGTGNRQQATGNRQQATGNRQQ
ncbi:MAG: hypothetical protein AB4426_22435 [Xenococcaceae cyanobacterium]